MNFDYKVWVFDFKVQLGVFMAPSLTKQVQANKGLKLNMYKEDNLNLKFGMLKKGKMKLGSVLRGVELEKLLLLLFKYKRLSLLKES